MVAVTLYGIQRPAGRDGIVNGDLVVWRRRDDTIYGLAAADAEGPIYVFLNGDSPFTIAARDAVEVPDLIDGELEFEPLPNSQAFDLPAVLDRHTPGLLVGPNGEVGLKAVFRSHGQPYVVPVNLESGEVFESTATLKSVRGFRISVRQAGRREAFAIADLD